MRRDADLLREGQHWHKGEGPQGARLSSRRWTAVVREEQERALHAPPYVTLLWHAYGETVSACRTLPGQG